MANEPISPHDRLFKAAFTAPERAATLLRAFTPEAVAGAIDWRSLRHVPATFIDAALREQQADLLFAARASGRDLWIYVLLEHKSGPDPWTPWQLLRYIVRIWERERRAPDAAKRLPPILPLVLHHGQRPFAASQELRSLIDLQELPAEFATLQPQLQYLVVDLASHSEARLRRLDLDPASLLTLLHLRGIRKARATAKLLVRWRDVFRRLIADDSEGVRLLLRQLVAYAMTLTHDEPEAMSRAYESIQPDFPHMDFPLAQKWKAQWRREARAEGLAEGKAEGIAEGRAEALRTILRNQFELRWGEIGSEEAGRIERASPDQLMLWLGRVVTVKTSNDLFA